MQITNKPHSSENVLDPPDVLSPWKRMMDAIRVEVENPTK